ncbi:alpha/beta hydrolase [Pseudarthrobacter sp. NIBRBAC000502771]|jgi:alpha-beta hydrolase superfamily lysophospholipase|uniref:alpha/beta hydrolase n=1 Tax=Pseudarthrobacter sp. NIBRBAC000502771 TaxID=2590774 RepID=UPI001131C17B|nr:alpha/beta fold hydrolase [Pseudarthrobacter sp. NIBRBAC000502771]QDG64166.1 alpha/beta hydrolase [Pseudarthrobacter sp. NIBRBAC000502771]
MDNRGGHGGGRNGAPDKGGVQAGQVPRVSAHRPVLSVLEASGNTRGVVLVLHGGKAHSRDPVEARHLSPARMVPFARDLHRAGRKHGLAVWSLRNSVRGWNGSDMSPLQDARWALQQIADRHPGVPVFLLGHSMGGLTAMCAADHPQVEAVVALAPWLSPETPAYRVAGRKVLIIHGTTDHMTSPSQSLAFARRASADAASMQYVSLKGVGHFMLRKVRVWHTLATGFVIKSFAESTGAGVQPSRAFVELLPESAVHVTL